MRTFVKQSLARGGEALQRFAQIDPSVGKNVLVPAFQKAANIA